VTARVSPTEGIRADIDELFATEGDLGETLEQVARLGARLLLQSALEAEVTEFLGRNRYESRRLAIQAKAGSRNGYGPATVKTTAGPITLERPKLRGTDMAFASRLLGAGVTKTNALESLVIAGFVRGLSVRDVEAALAEALGPEATVSRSTVSRICEAIKEEFDRSRTPTCRGSSSSTCSWMGVTSRCTQGPRPSRCWWPGASTRVESRTSWAWSRGARSPPTPGRSSCAGC